MAVARSALIRQTDQIAMPATTAEMPPLIRRLGAGVRDVMELRALPAPVARFQWRARRLARRLDDRFSLASATRPADLAVLLELADGRRRVVELGTATAWTAISLALADPLRLLTTYDPVTQPLRERYLALAQPRARSQIELVAGPGLAGPRDRDPIELLYIDSSHEREQTIAELHAWRPALAPGALVIFDDYVHPAFPGVREAIAELGLEGELRGTLFVHRPSAS